MKVIIPLAGKGTRLRPHTHVTPKPMLRIAGKPVMDYVMDDVKRLGDEPIQDVHLQVGDAFRVTPGTVHFMEAVTDCDVLEASTPELDDIVRIKDRYGREGTSAP